VGLQTTLQRTQDRECVVEEHFTVSGRIAERWMWWGGPGGPFGRPVAAEETVPGRPGARQRFERGEIAWSPEQDLLTSVYRLRNEACLEWSRPGVDHDAFQFNVVIFDELTPDGAGQGQDAVSISFEEDMPPEDELFVWTRLQGFGRYEFVVRSCDGDDRGGWSIPVRLEFTGMGPSPFPNDAPVEGPIGERWHELGAWTGPLGRPTGPAFSTASGVQQRFTNGVIATVPAQGPRMVIAAYERPLPPTDDSDVAKPALELNWGGSDVNHTRFRVDYLRAGLLTQGFIEQTAFPEWARTRNGSGQHQVRNRLIIEDGKEKWIAVEPGPYLLRVFAVGEFDLLPTEPIATIGLTLTEPGAPFLIPVELPALDGSPAAAYASQRDRALAVARGFAERRPLRPNLRGGVAQPRYVESGEGDGLRLMAHFAAADEESDFCTPGAVPSLVLLHIELRQMRRGATGTAFHYNDIPGLAINRNGDYDAGLRCFVVLAHRYRHLLTDGEMGFILHRLVPPGLSGGHDPNVMVVDLDVDVDPLAELGLDAVLSFVTPVGFLTAGGAVAFHITLQAAEEIFAHGLPESENHILMIESCRYLVNQLMFERTGDPQYDNRAKGLTGWLLDYLRVIAQHDFLEFNARAYTRYSVHALLNLHEFAKDRELRTIIANILDYQTVKFALSSTRYRRVGPYRRLAENRNWPNTLQDNLVSEKTDPMTGFFWTWLGDRDRDGNPTTNFPEWWSFWAVLVGFAAYRPPPQAYSLALTTYPPVQHTIYHGNRPRVEGTSDVPDAGVEIYYKSPSFLLSAGGSRLNSGYGNDWIHPKDVAIAQSTTLIPTRAEPRFSELIRFDPHENQFDCVNVGVHLGFACGANLRIPTVWYQLTGTTADHGWTFFNLNSDLRPPHPTDLGPVGKLGFYVAAYSTPTDSPPDNVGMLYAMEAVAADGTEMPFEKFRDDTRAANRHLPTKLEYAQTYDFHTADGHVFTCRLSTRGDTYSRRVLRMDGQDILPPEFSGGPLVTGHGSGFLTTPETADAPGHGHAGLVQVTSPDCPVPLVLDSRNPGAPARTDLASACPDLVLGRAEALFAVAARNRQMSATLTAFAEREAGLRRSIRAAHAAVGALRGFDPPEQVAARYRTLYAQCLHDLWFRLMSDHRSEDELDPLAPTTVLAYVAASEAPGADAQLLGSELGTLSSRLSGLGMDVRALQAAKASVEVLDAGTPPVGHEATYLFVAAGAARTLVIRLLAAHQDASVAAAADHAIAVFRQAAAAPGADRSTLKEVLASLAVFLDRAGHVDTAADVRAAATQL
jgi:hypothetical protein